MKLEGHTVEKHTCSECLHFKVVPLDIPICKKKLMSVCGDMHVTYKNEDGTCFEKAICDAHHVYIIPSHVE